MGNVLGGFEHQVLIALTRLGRESYTVPIVAELERHIDRTVAPSAVYVTLRRLEKRGLLTARLEPPGKGEGGRARRVFSMTTEGVQVLHAARAELDRLWDGFEAPEV